MVRQGNVSDIAFVLAVEESLFSDPWSADAISAHLTSPHLTLLICEEAGERQGYLLGSFIAPEGEIFRVATLPAFRRRGVGEALCRAHLSRCGTCYLEVRRTNTAARALYERLGFVLTGERRDYYKNPREDACLYRWQ